MTEHETEYPDRLADAAAAFLARQLVLRYADAFSAAKGAEWIETH